MIWSLCISTFLASLLGSMHCAGMCGVFAAMATSSERPSPSERLRLFSAYSAGRWISYATLGAVSGLIGQVFDVGATAAGFTQGAAIVAASVVTLTGLSHLLQRAGVMHLRVPVPALLLNAARTGHRLIGDWPPTLRAASIGLLTTVLPCHWLYTFAAAAAGTADPLGGAAVMTFFWLGTLPALAAAAASVSKCLGSWRSIMPWATACLMIGTGVTTIVLRLMRPSCHEGLPSDLVSTILSSYCHGTDAH
jgi:uncharacterized protein